MFLLPKKMNYLCHSGLALSSKNEGEPWAPRLNSNVVVGRQILNEGEVRAIPSESDKIIAGSLQGVGGVERHRGVWAT